MFTTRLRKIGNSQGLIVPKDELERLGLEEGATVTVEVRQATVHVEPQLAPDLQASMQRVKARPQLRKALRILGS